MKELSVEEKAKRYDEAIEKFDVILNLNTVKESGTIFADDVRKILPELKESEEERIREKVIDVLKLNVRGAESQMQASRGIDRTFEVYACNKVIALLEKRGEQKPWSEEDEETIDYLIDYLESELDSSYTDLDKETFTKEINLLKSLRPQSQWKPSDELDEASYQVGIKRVLENPESYGLTKYNWRPSEEQMDALNDVISSRDIKYDVLSELWKDLKRLRKE